MTTPIEGLGPTMRLGLVQETGRHTALDASVVFHEATHGLSNRLVGGALNNQSLVQPQSAGMGEGWSDFVSCQIMNSDVVGAWVVDHPNGIRGFPYDDQFPATFADIGTGRYTEMHAVGEVWCAVLMSTARGVGKQRALNLVIDSLKLMPENPSMLDARDAMLVALEHDLAAGVIGHVQHDAELRALWQAFAKAGLGRSATSTGATLQGVVASFEVPPSTVPAAGRPWSGFAATGPPGTVPPGASITAVGVPGAAVELFVVGGDGHLYAGARA
jgi:extracellular elastinolytic metalloproteinase